FQLMGMLLPDGTILALNQRALDFVGARREDVTGRPLWETPGWSATSRDRCKAAVVEAAQNRFVRYENTGVAADGTTETLDFSLKPVADETGRVLLLIAEGHDITERKQAEAELQKATEAEAERARLAELGRDVANALGRGETPREFLQPCAEAVVR